MPSSFVLKKAPHFFFPKLFFVKTSFRIRSLNADLHFFFRQTSFAFSPSSPFWDVWTQFLKRFVCSCSSSHFTEGREWIMCQINYISSRSILVQKYRADGNRRLFHPPPLYFSHSQQNNSRSGRCCWLLLKMRRFSCHFQTGVSRNFVDPFLLLLFPLLFFFLYLRCPKTCWVIWQETTLCPSSHSELSQKSEK